MHIDDKESQSEGQKNDLSVLTTCITRKLVEGNAEDKDVEDVDQSGGDRVEKLPVLAFLRLVHELDAQIKLELLH